MKYKIEGLEELEKTLKELKNLPTKCVTRAARAGAKIVLAAAREKAPQGKTKNLRRGLRLKLEKSKTKGKRVYQISFSSKFNEFFVKLSKSGKRSYYPASQEFGFVTRSGGKVPGKRYLKSVASETGPQAAQEIIKTLSEEIDKLK
jgi:hypothetical protein